MFKDASAFNQSLDRWDVSKVTEMSQMFAGASSFNKPLNTWKVNNVKTMYHMFYQAKAFNQNLASWNVSKNTNITDIFTSSALSKDNFCKIYKSSSWKEKPKYKKYSCKK